MLSYQVLRTNLLRPLILQTWNTVVPSHNCSTDVPLFSLIIIPVWNGEFHRILIFNNHNWCMKVLHKLYSTTTLHPPQLDITWPSWLGIPSSNTMFFFSLIIYYMSVSGITYDIINSPPAFGVESDEFGNTRPVAILKWQVRKWRTRSQCLL